MVKNLFYLIGIIILLTFEVLKMYLIAPLPGSQIESSVNLAFWIHNNIWWIRIFGFILLLPKIFLIFGRLKNLPKVLIVIPLAFYAVIFYVGNYKFFAEAMFLKMKSKNLADLSSNKIPQSDLVIGVGINNQFRSYPIQIIGYHHQIMDTIGNEPVMITYCTVCRTGRVYSPLVNGKVENFRLVGMDLYNAMFEDNTTKSWWQQSTGICIAGKLKGQKLKEIFSSQMTLKSWNLLHPESKTLQFDPNFNKQYAFLKKYGEGNIESSLEKSELKKSNQSKSWVITAIDSNNEWAFDYIKLKKNKLLQCGNLLALMPNENEPFKVFNVNLNGEKLSFEFKYTKGGKELIDTKTKSVWNFNGECIWGFKINQKLTEVQSYQEFLHSWKSFHPKSNFCPTN